MKNIKKSITVIFAATIGSSYFFSNTTAFAGREENLYRTEGLQVPEKLEITIDPMEVNGKGQIYSERYVVKNSGGMTGILSLSDFTCSPQEKSGIKVKTDREGLHDNKEKSIYVEIEFDNGDGVVLSQPDEEYEVELRPDEELSFTFAGEVNENSLHKWEDNDVAVSMLYSWKVRDVGEEIENISETKELVSDDEIEKTKQEKPETIPFSIKGAFINSMEDSEEAMSIQIPKELDIIVDPMESNEKGQIYSEQYAIRNTGKNSGKLILYDFACQVEEEAAMIVKTENTDINGDENKAVYIEAIFGNGDKVILSQPDTRYEVELKPDEEVLISFLGEMSEKARQEWKSDEMKIEIKYNFKENEEE